MDNLKPNKRELEALNLFYNRFYDLYNEINRDDFFEKDSQIRFYKIREIFGIYKELSGYEPIRYYLQYVKKGGRPPLEGFIVDDLFGFIRNILFHFPIFDNWDSIYINKNLATWNKSGTIHKFLLNSVKIKIDGKGIIKYRIWEKDVKKMTYIQINLPEQYENNNIYVKDIISEKDGVKLCTAFMKEVLDTQVNSDEEPNIVIMSQVYIPLAHSRDELLPKLMGGKVRGSLNNKNFTWKR